MLWLSLFLLAAAIAVAIAGLLACLSLDARRKP
jgi:hypothetical protein